MKVKTRSKILFQIKHYCKSKFQIHYHYHQFGQCIVSHYICWHQLEFFSFSIFSNRHYIPEQDLQ
jgi:hypothetical protein